MMKRALIVDDDHANRSLWEFLLVDRGYEVVAAADVTTGTKYVADDISLYLVDYHLPDGHGTSIINSVRNHNNAAMVVVVSMDDDADVIRESMRAGGNLFMVKPSSPAIMQEVLSEIESGDLDANTHQLINRHGRRAYH